MIDKPSPSKGRLRTPKKIPLTQGKFAIVDAEDYEELAKHKWYFAIYPRREVRKNNKRIQMGMHHAIMGEPPKGFCTDHINGDKLDNRKQNLRIVNRTVNNLNKTKTRKNTSGFKGVFLKKKNKKWYAAIGYGRKSQHIGYYDSAVEASRAYQRRFNEILNIELEKSKVN